MKTESNPLDTPWQIYRMLMEAENKRHENIVSGYDAMLEKHREICSHSEYYSHTDPAGDSSESYRECAYCGKKF